MKIGGPFFDASRRQSPKKWWLSYFIPKLTPKGAPILDPEGRAVVVRKRPYYKSQELAQADKPRLLAQYGASGAGGMLSRVDAEQFEYLRNAVPEIAPMELAKFWRLHHPRAVASTIAELVPEFLLWVKSRIGEERHHNDLKSRLKLFCLAFGDRLPATVTREEFMTWLLSLGKGGRTVLNQKRAVVNFFNWLTHDKRLLPSNQLAGIKKRQLPKSATKEIEFLSLVQMNRYVRACERYDPDLVAHEIIQFISGVRADDEMADFDGKWVKPQTREIVIPSEIAKTGRREVIDTLEPNFWDWWKEYGREGILRPKNYEQRWFRIRVLAAIEDRAKADELAALPIKTLLGEPTAKAALKAWPWNARRRTFCTYHIAKHQSADKTALILRHRGEAATLHNSYRGLGVTQAEGIAYCEMRPNPVARPILPARSAPKGIIRLQLERKRSTPDAPEAAAS